MQHPYTELEPVIAAQISKVQILPSRAARANAIAKHLLGYKEQYAAVEAATGVKIVVVAGIHERESDADFSTYLGNGDPLNHVSTHVPRGRGPFLGPNAWARGASDALTLDRLNQVSDWTWERMIYEDILYNGFGPLSHGRQSGYAWAGTNIYDGGKYVADGQWDPTVWDSQLGCYIIAAEMVKLDPSLQLPRAKDVPPVAADAPPPQLVGVGAQATDTHSATWLQQSLNKLGAHPQLAVDGSYGRMTRRAVETFQDRAGITVDGFTGPETVAAIEAALAKVA